MQHLERLLSKLDGVSETANGYRACCPSHDDTNPSLGITCDSEGHIRLRCWSAGCTISDILQAINLTPDDLDPDPDDVIISSDDDSLVESDSEPLHRCNSTLSDDEADHRSEVYDCFLENLTLSEAHRQDLIRRGLDDAAIDLGGYRSYSAESAVSAIDAMRSTFSDTDLLSVPGFVTRNDGSIRAVGSQPGLVIPSRDMTGRCVALKIRRDGNNLNSGKYACISGGGGPSCGTPTHVPLGIQSPVATVRITEGELKADVATCLSDIPTIGIPGISNWKPAFPVLAALDAQSVHVAFDADCQTKVHVAKQLKDLTTALSGAGFDVRIETWSLEDGKGIDDLLAAGKSPQVLVAQEAGDFLNTILTRGEVHEIQESCEETIPPSIGGNPAASGPPHTNKVLTFPLEVFPHSLQGVVTQIAKSVGCQIDLVAIPMIVVAAAAIGASRAIETKPGWTESPRMYIAVVAPPGSGKSPAESAILRPVYRRQNIYKARHKIEKAEFATGDVCPSSLGVEASAECPANAPITATQPVSGDQTASSLHTDESTCTAADACSNAGSITEVLPTLDPVVPVSDATPAATEPAQPPVLRRVLVGDVTTESLATILDANPRGILMSRDEIASWIKGMDQYRGGRGTDRQFFMSCWSGQTAQIDRKTLREPIIIPRPFINILGGIQPDMLPLFVDEKGRSDGFLDRILFSYPDSTSPPLWTEEGIDESVKKIWEDLLDRLYQLDMDYNEVEDVVEPQVLTLTADAKEEARKWYNDHVTEMGSSEFPEPLEGPWAKLPAYFFRQALTLQLIHSADQGIEASFVDIDAVCHAIKLIEYFKSHIRKVYASLIRDAEDRRVEVVLRWVTRHGGECSARDLQSANVARIKRASEANLIMKDMVDRGLGSLVDRSKASGKKMTHFVMYPQLSANVG